MKVGLRGGLGVVVVVGGGRGSLCQKEVAACLLHLFPLPLLYI